MNGTAMSLDPKCFYFLLSLLHESNVAVNADCELVATMKATNVLVGNEDIPGILDELEDRRMIAIFPTGAVVTESGAIYLRRFMVRNHPDFDGIPYILGKQGQLWRRAMAGNVAGAAA